MNQKEDQSPQNCKIDVEINHSAQLQKQTNIQKQQIEPVEYPNFNNNPVQQSIKFPACKTAIQLPSENNNYQQSQDLEQQLIMTSLSIKYDSIETPLQRRTFISKINLLFIYQQLFQVFLIFISRLSSKFYSFYCNFFYKNFFESRATFFLIIIFTIVFLLIVRYNKTLRKVKLISKNQSKQNQFTYAIYFVLYTLFANCIALGDLYFYNKYQNNNAYVVFYYFSAYSFQISLAILIQLILIQVQIKKLKESNLNLTSIMSPYLAFLNNSCYALFFGFFLLISFDRYEYLEDFFPSMLSIFWPIIFTSFYIPSLLEVSKGKVINNIRLVPIGTPIITPWKCFGSNKYVPPV